MSTQRIPTVIHRYMLVPKIMEGLITGGAISTIKLEGQVPTSLDLDYKQINKQINKYLFYSCCQPNFSKSKVKAVHSNKSPNALAHAPGAMPRCPPRTYMR